MIVKRMLWGVGACLMLLTMSCKKDRLIQVGTPSEQELKTVRVQIDQFSQQINPMLASYDTDLARMLTAQGNVEAHPDIQVLYYWSFNQSTLVPDIGLDTLRAAIHAERNNGDSHYNFGVGKAYTPYIAGRAWNITGPKKVLVSMPISHVDYVEQLRFDMIRSGTGPGAYTISYVLDDSEEPIILSEAQSIKQSWSSYEFDLSQIDLSDNTEWIHLQWEFSEGERNDSTRYNPSSGTIRMDNLSLTGGYPVARMDPILLGAGNVHYHIFSRSDSSLVLQGHQSFDSNKGQEPLLEFKLEEGAYFLHAAAIFSPDEWVLPDSIQHAGDLYLHQPFHGKNAPTFAGNIPSLNVSDDMSISLNMERMYSQIRMELTDSTGLEDVHRMTVTALKEMTYFPYLQAGIHEKEGTETVEFIKDFSQHPFIEFNYFMGITTLPLEVGYLLSAYDASNNLLKQINLQASILNNVELVFRGNLLESSSGSNLTHRFNWNQVWQEQKIIDF